MNPAPPPARTGHPVLVRRGGGPSQLHKDSYTYKLHKESYMNPIRNPGGQVPRIQAQPEVPVHPFDAGQFGTQAAQCEHRGRRAGVKKKGPPG